MKQKIALVIMFLPYFVLAQGITLNEAIQHSIANNERILQYAERVKQRQNQENEAWGNFLPSVNFDATYNHFDNPLEMDLSPIRDVIITLQAKNQVELTNIGNVLAGKGALTDAQRAAVLQQSQAGLNKAIPAFSAELKRQDNKYLTFSLVQPLFMGGKLLAAKNAASAELQSSTIELEKVKNDVTREVIESYINTVLMQEVLATRRTVLANVSLHKQRAEKLFAQGLIPRYQVVRAEAAVAEAERNCIDDSVKLDLVKLQLATLTGLDASKLQNLRDSLLYRPVVMDSLGLVGNAIANNPYIGILEQKQEAAHAGFVAARSGMLPSVAAFGKYECLPEYLSALEPRWVVGVKLQYNLFNGFKDYSKMENYSHLENELNFMKTDIRKNLTLLMQKNIMAVQSSAAKYQKLNSNLELAEENLRVATKRAEAGTGIILEIVDANSFYEKTRIDRSAALAEYYKAYAATLHTINKINDFAQIWNQD